MRGCRCRAPRRIGSVTGSTANPATRSTFPAATSGTETETWFSIGIPTGGTTCAGALVIMYRGSITPALTVTGGDLAATDARHRDQRELTPMAWNFGDSFDLYAAAADAITAIGTAAAACAIFADCGPVRRQPGSW